MNSKYPIFVISYNRPQNHTTAKQLALFEFPHYLILHKEQVDEYKKYFTLEMEKYLMKYIKIIKMLFSLAGGVQN